tara:strand:- start:2688 stop:3725 length:1038 start_codon:yes stop_codon:yes gene_type:complete
MTKKQLDNKKFFVTGGAGFIGSEFIIQILEKYKTKVLNLDKISPQSSPIFLEGLKNYKLVQGDLIDSELVKSSLSSFQPDFIIHFAAESHVDRSISSPRDFVDSNIIGTFNLLDSLRALIDEGILSEEIRLLNVSTDEVYGSLSLKDKPFTENSQYDPSSVYSASKVSSDMLVNSFLRTYGLRCQTTHCSNNYGPRQFPEKLIPFSLYSFLSNLPVSIYGDGTNIRDWIFVKDHVLCLIAIMENDFIPGHFNIGSSQEMSNNEIVESIKNILINSGKYDHLDYKVEFVEDRLGHDFRYAIDSGKSKDLFDWEPAYKFDSALEVTIDWYLENIDWLKESIERINKK